MISITKLNGAKLTINCELILTIEETPDTTITMTTGDKYIARETIEEISQKVVVYKQKIFGVSIQITDDI